MTPEEAADALLSARSSRAPLRPFTDERPELDEQWGYAVQDVDRRRRLASGEHLVGMKLGLTSRAKQQTMAVDQPIVGFLTDAMALGGEWDSSLLGALAQPRIEPEIAFRLGRDLDAPLRFWAAAEAIDAVAVAAEVIDSRYAGFGFRLPDVVADNTSAAGLLVGPWLPSSRAGELDTAGCVLSVREQVVHTGTGAAVLGHPLHALVHLSWHLSRRQERLPAGSIVLTGAVTDAVPLQPGAVHRVEIRDLGEVELVGGWAL